MTIARDKKRDEVPSRAKFLAAAIKRGVAENGYVPADINTGATAVRIVQAPKGNRFVEWKPKGSNPKNAIRMRDLKKFRAWKADMEAFEKALEFLDLAEAEEGKPLATASKPSKSSQPSLF